MIVSVSRRCDIPRFQFDWFMEAVNAGFCETVNPFNANQKKRVSLLPQDVDIFVFWTRDPRHILANTDELEKRGFRFYVMVSLTGYPGALEPNVPTVLEVATAMKELAKKIGQDRIIWRYDPVIFTSITDIDFHRGNFSALARELSGSVRRVIISLYDEYHGAKKRLEKLEKTSVLKLPDAGDSFKNGVTHLPLFAEFAKVTAAAGMEIQTCAEKQNFSSVGIKGGACIDAGLIEKLWGLKLDSKDKNQRQDCLCCKSADIGVYGTCAAGCAYCYARR